jgi:paraquat-inducible protein A
MHAATGRNASETPHDLVRRHALPDGIAGWYRGPIGTLVRMETGCTLHAGNPGRSRIWLGLLGAALTLQVSALFLDFMRVDVFIAGGETYSLLRTVQLLWEARLWLVACLIVGFSVIFPFVKIALLAWAWTRLPAGPRRTHVLEWMGRLGKWSMLDPFSVLVLMMLASDQWAVSASTFLGVYAFLTAVALTMGLSIWATAIDAGPGGHPGLRRAARQSLLAAAGWRGWAGLASLLAAIACFAGAINVPFLTINQFLLRSESYGIGNAAWTLFRDQNWPLAFLGFACLIIMPGGVLLAELWAWLAPARPWVHRRRRRWIGFAREWCMLDVMCVALGLFLLEGQALIRTKVDHGLWLLMAAAGTLTLAGWLGRRAAAESLRRMHATT